MEDKRVGKQLLVQGPHALFCSLCFTGTHLPATCGIGTSFTLVACMGLDLPPCSLPVVNWV